VLLVGNADRNSILKPRSIEKRGDKAVELKSVLVDRGLAEISRITPYKSSQKIV
tara:strand:+ start:316 stop:477 length:162 start_codon:yes stop_codon:yes gene_type:complete